MSRHIATDTRGAFRMRDAAGARQGAGRHRMAIGRSAGEGPRRPGARSVALGAAVCALVGAGGYTGALWAGGSDLDAIRIDTGNLGVQILRNLEGDVDGDGVRWWAASDAADASAWVSLDDEVLVVPGDLVVATVTFDVALEGHNLLADLRLDGSESPIAPEGELVEAMTGHALGVLSGTADAAQAYTALKAGLTTGGADAPVTIELPRQTQADDTQTYTVAALFQFGGDAESADAADLDGLTAAIPRLMVVLEQVRSVDEPSAASEGGA